MLVVNSRFLTQNITGVQRFAVEISLRLKEILKDEVVFVAPKNIIQDEIAEQLNVKVIGNHTGHIWEQWDLPRWLKHHNNSLLLSLCNTAPLFYSNKVTVIHDVTFIRYPQTFEKSFLLAYKLMIPTIIKTSKKVITVSEFSKQEIMSVYKINQDKLFVVYNAVNKMFIPSNYEF